MHIVLSGALPDPAAARALLPRIAQTAPTLTRWLNQGQMRAHVAPGMQTGCTPEEYWRLRLHGFEPDAGQTHAAGLGPLLAATPGHGQATQADDAVWLAELVYLSPTQHGAAMMTSAELAIDDQQDQALYDSLATLGVCGPSVSTREAVQPVTSGDFTLHPLRPGLWRVNVPAGFHLMAASPAQVARSAVNDWWPQHDEARAWRRLFNEIQMLWHAHPINQQRQRQGQPPVNALWLFGGARPAQLDATVPHQVHWLDDLLQPWLRQDWSTWLQVLGELDARELRPLEGQGARPTLALTGRDRIAEIIPTRKPAWLRKLAGHGHDWRHWWSHQD